MINSLFTNSCQIFGFRNQVLVAPRDAGRFAAGEKMSSTVDGRKGDSLSNHRNDFRGYLMATMSLNKSRDLVDQVSTVFLGADRELSSLSAPRSSKPPARCDQDSIGIG